MVDLKTVLQKHAEWLRGISTGIRADLSGADLRSADLSGADLRSANLSGANLSGANLSGANLSGANLSGANLRSANLRSADLSGANLRSADLSGANLRSADLSGADLRSANLSGADLSGADLRSANLRSADLSGADLRSANLSGANLSGANLSGAKNAALVIARTRVAPLEGEIIAWKSCLHGVIVKLKIPAAAKRSNAFCRKCRAEFVEVLEIFNGDRGLSQHDGKTEYRVGETVRCHEWCEDFTKECDGGIHFFMTREEAEAY